MTDSFTSSYNSRCQGWTNPSNLYFGPRIISLSSFYSPAGATSLVTINGANFYSYSSISFGTYLPTVFFVNSNILQFYVPTSLNAGTYAIQVFNGSFSSNIVNYTLDNSSGYWILQANNTIMNTNSNGIVAVQSLSRGAPISINETQSPYIVPSNVNWIICYNLNAVSDIIIQLPTGTMYTGREIMIKTVPNSSLNAPTVYSSQSNVMPFDSVNSGDVINTIINSVTTKWVTLVYDSTNWIVMQEF